MNRRECLDVASAAVSANETSYGSPESCFQAIADLWNAYGLKFEDGFPVTPETVVVAMILVKVARQTNASKPDNWVDIAGYAALGAELNDDKS